MNKYEELFDSIYKQTKNNQLKWKQLKKSANADVIFNPNLVFRQFAATYIKNEDEFEVVFIEKKFDDPEHDYAYERYASEIIVLDEDNELIATLTDSVIERGDMLKLAELIEQKSDRAKKLFD